MSDLPVSLSASKLKQYDRCPEAFRLKYMEGREAEGGENHYLRRGNAVHEAIEDLLTEPSADLADEEGVQFALKRRYWDNGGQSGYDLSDENDEFVLDCLEVAGRFIAKKDPEVLGVESEVPFGSTEVDHPPGFNGYIDVATETEVWDWKTGSSSGKDLAETLQGAVYMAGYFHHVGRPPEAIHFVYLKEGKVRSREPSDEMWSTVVSKAQTLLAAIEHDSYPAKPDDSKCYWCDFEVHCSASPVGGGGIDWESYP